MSGAVYLLAGGRARRHATDPGLAAALAETGVARPSLAYIGAANGDDPSFFAWFEAAARVASAGDVRLAPLAHQRADPAAARRILDTADAIFVSGGDVEAGMRILSDTGMIEYLRARHRDGAVVLGLSAGSIILAREWVRWPDPQHPERTERFACLDLAPLWCDTHGEDDDWEELRALLALLPPDSTGHGIPSGVTLRIDSNGRAEALGGPIHRFHRGVKHVRRIADLQPLRPAQAPAGGPA